MLATHLPHVVIIICNPAKACAFVFVVAVVGQVQRFGTAQL
jgi:hypothetical protein